MVKTDNLDDIIDCYDCIPKDRTAESALVLMAVDFLVWFFELKRLVLNIKQ